MEETNFQSDSIPKQNKNTTWDYFGEDIIIFQQVSKQYFVLNTVAARIWELSDGRFSLGDIASKLLDEFDIQQPHTTKDVTETIEGMVELGILDNK